MKKFHLFHPIPHPKMHGLNGYKEVIESVEWGLKQLGHEVTYAVDRYSPDATNIIFGAQVVPVAILEQLPKNSIVYNFEQMRGVSPERLKEREELAFAAQNFRIWEYSESNLEAWGLLGVKSVKHVPVAYAPILTRIPSDVHQEIDVLIYGLSCQKRATVFHRLSTSGIKVVFASGLYAELRDTLISKSKLVANINLYDHSRIFEVVRCSYLLANKKAVIANIDPGTYIEALYSNAIKGSELESFVDDCEYLLSNDQERLALAERGFAAFSQTDIRAVLKDALI